MRSRAPRSSTGRLRGFVSRSSSNRMGRFPAGRTTENYQGRPVATDPHKLGTKAVASLPAFPGTDPTDILVALHSQEFRIITPKSLAGFGGYLAGGCHGRLARR